MAWPYRRRSFRRTVCGARRVSVLRFAANTPFGNRLTTPGPSSLRMRVSGNAPQWARIRRTLRRSVQRLVASPLCCAGACCIRRAYLPASTRRTPHARCGALLTYVQKQYHSFRSSSLCLAYYCHAYRIRRCCGSVGWGATRTSHAPCGAPCSGRWACQAEGAQYLMLSSSDYDLVPHAVLVGRNALQRKLSAVRAWPTRTRARARPAPPRPAPRTCTHADARRAARYVCLLLCAC